MKRMITGLLALWLLVLPVWAEDPPEETQQAYIQISSPEELLAMADHPEGNYVLMKDLDMTGVDWPCPDFSGKFDGNGHSILNLTIKAPGESQGQVLDGNQKEYTAAFAGFFGRLTNAEVRELNLVNLRLLVQTEEPCMAGGMAGYSMDSTILNCSVSGCLELRAHQGMFGLAGMVGYGVAAVGNCQVDTTLICVDTDRETGDEQFLGGVFGTGFVEVTDTQVKLDAYVSEHGYVHSGGIGGMLLQYPIGMGRTAYFRNNTVSGRIRFFEDFRARRAYCKALIGELMKSMNYNYGFTDNQTEHFQAEEVLEYDRELRPETCERPEIEETVVPSSCDSFGYTRYTCKTCGYTQQDHYTLYSHTVTEWQAKKPATAEAPGRSEGICDLCGARVKREDPVLPEEPEPETSEPAQPSVPEALPVPAPTAPKKPLPKAVWIVLCTLSVVGILILVFILTEPQGKHVKKRRRKNGTGK